MVFILFYNPELFCIHYYTGIWLFVVLRKRRSHPCFILSHRVVYLITKEPCGSVQVALLFPFLWLWNTAEVCSLTEGDVLGGLGWEVAGVGEMSVNNMNHTGYYWIDSNDFSIFMQKKKKTHCKLLKLQVKLLSNTMCCSFKYALQESLPDRVLHHYKVVFSWAYPSPIIYLVYGYSHLQLRAELL